jgi:hypothetical protein
LRRLKQPDCWFSGSFISGLSLLMVLSSPDNAVESQHGPSSVELALH